MTEYLGTEKKIKKISVDTLYQPIIGNGVRMITSAREVIATSPVENIMMVNHYINGHSFAMFDTKNTRYMVECINYIPA